MSEILLVVLFNQGTEYFNLKSLVMQGDIIGFTYNGKNTWHVGKSCAACFRTLIKSYSNDIGDSLTNFTAIFEHGLGFGLFKQNFLGNHHGFTVLGGES
jgi:hypothetical protein